MVVAGARAYYLRNIFHNHADDRCVTMLKSLADAMADDSVILLDELVLPTIGANPRAIDLDWTMMSLFSSKERTLADWKDLLARAEKGLSVRRVVEYQEGYHYSIIEVVKERK